MRDPTLPAELYRAAQVRELDRLAIERYRIPGAALMERAGGAAFAALRRRWPEVRSIAVVCGTGNNGGDGFVLARHAIEAGWSAAVGVVGAIERIGGDAAGALKALRAAGGSVQPFDARQLAAAEVIVDALFGTGLTRSVEGAHRDAIEAMASAGKPVLAVDLPSGLDADTGRVLGCAVPAALTVTFVGLKQGLFTGDAPAYCGAIEFDDLGVPPEAYAQVPPSARRLTPRWARAGLAPRARTAHKGECGHVLVVGGAPGTLGAVRLAGEAAARAGAGLVSLATHPEHAAAISAACPELMSHAVAGPDELAPLLARADVVAIGPGLGQSAWAQALLARVFESRHPLVVDADALNLLARDALARGDWILTPHPGEAGRLLQCTTDAVQQDRFAAATRIAQRYQAVAVLKGAGTVVAGPDAAVYVIDTGNPGMASGGMGDVLTGVIAGLRAQGLPALDAAALGAWLHGAAGDEAARAGERGMMARDLLAPLRALVNPT